MRLIDADALFAEAMADGAYGYVDAKQIADAPTIDAVPVVRCKDCKWGREACGNIECSVRIDMYDPVEYHGYEWFCPLGERKDDDLS